MKILIDVEALEKANVITAQTAATLRQHAVRDTGSTAINLLLAFGAIVFAAGGAAFIKSANVIAVFGFGFVLLGYLIRKAYADKWGALGTVWMIIGALSAAGSIGWMIGDPLVASLATTFILGAVGILAESSLLIALVPLAFASAIGGSTGYWHACYEITVREPTLTIVLFSVLALVSFHLSKELQAPLNHLAIIFARMCVILVNFGFWIGSLWGDTPGHSWHDGGNLMSYYGTPRTVPETVFVIGWAAALVAIGLWGAKNGRRFIVNTAAVFGAIHFYTQWFERLGAQPLSVMIAGVFTVVIGLALWKYNRKVTGL